MILFNRAKCPTCHGPGEIRPADARPNVVDPGFFAVGDGGNRHEVIGSRFADVSQHLAIRTLQLLFRADFSLNDDLGMRRRHE